MALDRFLDTNGLRLLWEKIKALVAPKADKVNGAINGHLAILDASGNLADAGSSLRDLAQYQWGDLIEATEILYGKKIEKVGQGQQTQWVISDSDDDDLYVFDMGAMYSSGYNYAHYTYSNMSDDVAYVCIAYKDNQDNYYGLIPIRQINPNTEQFTDIQDTRNSRQYLILQNSYDYYLYLDSVLGVRTVPNLFAAIYDIALKTGVSLEGSIEGKADKVYNATDGNIAILSRESTGYGNLADSGHSLSEFSISSNTPKIVVPSVNGQITSMTDAEIASLKIGDIIKDSPGGGASYRDIFVTVANASNVEATYVDKDKMITFKFKKIGGVWSYDTYGSTAFELMVQHEFNFNPVAGNFSTFNQSGYLIDSGYSPSDFALASGLPTYTIVKLGTAETGYIASYVLQKDGVQEGATINIPKDYLVKSGSVIDVVEYNGQYYDATDTSHTTPLPVTAAGKYLDFVVNTVDSSGTTTHIYIAVNDLVDAYTEGNGIDISNLNVVSVQIDSSNSNGLSVSSNGLALATAVASSGGVGGSNGAMTAGDKEAINSIPTKADKVTGAISGNFAGLDANGNLTDSGKNPSSLPNILEVESISSLTSSQVADLTAGDIVISSAFAYVVGIKSNTYCDLLTTSNEQFTTVRYRSYDNGETWSYLETRIENPPSSSGLDDITNIPSSKLSGSTMGDVFFSNTTNKAYVVNSKSGNALSLTYVDPTTIERVIYQKVNNTWGYSETITTSLSSIGDISNKADKVSGATSGNFAGLDSTGNLTDSGYSASDFLSSSTTLTTITFRQW